MDIFEQRTVLESFRVLRDTREQDTARARKRYEAIVVPVDKATLSYGDYTYNAKLPSGAWIHDTSATISPAAVVERKMDIDEVAQCLTRSRPRFVREFERARAAGARVYLIIENGSWEHIISGQYRTRVHPNALLGSLVAFIVRYNAGVIFCKEESSGRLIREVLYRDLKERLERGEFD